MNEGIMRFKELMTTDQDFCKKLKSAAESYEGEKTEKAVYQEVFVPLLSEYGIFTTYEEFINYKDELSDQELTSDEIIQVAGGRPGKGWGAGICVGAGIGLGGMDSVGCCVVGYGTGAELCSGKGSGTAITDHMSE